MIWNSREAIRRLANAKLLKDMLNETNCCIPRSARAPR